MGGGPRVVGCTLGRRGTKGIVGDCLGILEIDLSDIGAIRLSLVVSNGSKLLLAALMLCDFYNNKQLTKVCLLTVCRAVIVCMGQLPYSFSIPQQVILLCYICLWCSR